MQEVISLLKELTNYLKSEKIEQVEYINIHKVDADYLSETSNDYLPEIFERKGIEVHYSENNIENIIQSLRFNNIIQLSIVDGDLCLININPNTREVYYEYYPSNNILTYKLKKGVNAIARGYGYKHNPELDDKLD